MKADVLGYTLKDGQLKIVGSVLDPQIKRLIVSAVTQYGKTRAVAIGVLLYILVNENKRILFIAPTIDQTNIIRNYVSEHIAASHQLACLVNRSRRSSPEDLKNEMSKKRLTLKNGCEIITLTAHGAGEEPGKQLMGFGGDADRMRRNFEHQRKRIGAKLKNSRINQITFHTFRHWKATMEYRKTRDILHVKEVLGHKSLNNTMLYTQLISFKDDDFTATVAHSEEEACKLIEAGFEYVCDFGQNKIFRKRK